MLHAAGAAEGVGTLEALEQRQLLALVTIPAGSIDPNTGLGTVTGWFDYAVPHLIREIPDAMQGQQMATIEEFEDETQGWAMGAGIPPNGQFFMGSDIRIAYSTQANNAIILTPIGFPPAVGPFDQQQDRDLYIDLNSTDRVAFEFFQGASSNTPSRRRTTNLTLTLRAGASGTGGQSDGDALKTDMNGTALELLRRGVVVRTFSEAQLAALITALPDGRNILQLTFEEGFDAFRFRAANQNNVQAYNDKFIIDDISTTFPSTRFAQYTEGKRRGVNFTFVGPAGASVELLDLYGRDITINTFLGVPMGAQLPLIDENGDGMPDLNDGIGRIIFRNTNSRTYFTMIGGAGSTVNDMGEQIAPQLPDDVGGNLDDFEQIGFGFELTNDDPPRATGLPDGTGSLIVGSPIVRNNTSATRYVFNNRMDGLALDQIFGAGGVNTGNFNRADQGVVVNGSIGSVVIHGMVFGSSTVQGSIGRWNSGVQYGSLTVNGDAGYIGVASDSGVFQNDDITGLDMTSRVTRVTGSQFLVGRTLGELAVGGRMGTSVQVLADINNPSRPPLARNVYVEREVVYAINPQASPPGRTVLQATLNRTAQNDPFARTTGQSTFFGNGLFRNDTLNSAEYIGYNGTAVRLQGNLGARDPVNSEDFTDVFAFAADPTRELVIQGALSVAAAGYARIVDRNGLVVAALNAGSNGRASSGNLASAGVMRFRPSQADVYYLVLSSRVDGGFGLGTSYDISISGIAPTTFGALTTGAGLGTRSSTVALGGAGGAGTDQPVVTMNAGSMGLMRIGVGFTDGMAMQQGPGDIINTNQDGDAILDYGLSSVTVPVDLFCVIAGSDIGGASITVGRNIGVIATGLSPLAGGTNLEGDLTAADIRAGGTIGVIAVSGSIGADQDPEPSDSFAGQVVIRTGTRGGRGDIGEVTVGGYIEGSNLTVTTSPGSVIDKFVILDNSATDTRGPYEIRTGIPRFTMGIGSDVRFMDFGLIQRPGDANLRIIVPYNQVYTFVDDAGASYNISITGGGAGANASFYEAFTLSPDGSQGVALARLHVRLAAGANLNITATGTQSTGELGATISIGRIIIDGTGGTDDGGALSSVLITSAGVQAEIDVWRIQANIPLNTISNTTRGRGDRAGDIVAIDAVSLNTLTVSGNVGLTETSGAGPRLLGPFLGINGDGLPVSAAAIDRGIFGGAGNDWDGSIFVPVQFTDYDPANPLEHLGSPIDPYLNGIIVRTGDLLDVRAGAALGDVIVAAGDLLNAQANSDNIRPFGAFEGIIGSIYANAINTIDIGDGLLGAGPSPFAASGIFANDEIVAVNATRVRGARIEGVIVAANEDNLPRTTIGTGANQRNLAAPLSGFGTLMISDGFVNGAFIQSVALEDWWISPSVQDQGFIVGDVNMVTLTNTSLVRSEIAGVTVGTVRITGGAYDSTTINAIENIALVVADEYRNSTLLGHPAEVHANAITSSRNIGSIETTNLTGDIADLTIDVIGTLTGRIAAGNLLRLSIDVDNVINLLSAGQDIKATSVNAGRLANMTVGRNLRNTSLTIAGPIDIATVGNEITGLTVTSSGPDGRIGTLRANGRIDANISSSGPVQIIESVTSDISGTITTTDTDGNVGTIRAGRDLLIDAMFTGNAGTITAARHIGRAADGNDRALDIRGSLGSLSAGGQIHSDILVGQDVTGTITRGIGSSKPGNDTIGVGDIRVFGRINALSFTGDVNSNIISYSGGIGTITILNGSLRKGKSISALDGSLDRLTITGGDLLGDVHADADITLIELLSGAGGYKSHIGISRFKSTGTSVDANRNELPPGTFATAGADGPRISAGHDIGRIFLQGGSIYESTIIAGRVVREVTLSGGAIRNDQFTTAQASFIIAGDRVENITVTGKSDNLTVIAGLVSLGGDNLPGGVGSAADSVKQGSIGRIDLRASGNKDIVISAGLNAGADGVYNTTDDTLAAGVSSIDSVNVRGAKTSSVFADGSIGSVSGGSGLKVRQNGRGLAAADPTLIQNTRPAGSVRVNAGQIFNFTTPSNQRGTLLFDGPGRAFFDAANNRVVLLDTTSASSLVVQARKNGQNNNGAWLSNFSVVGKNNAALGSLSINAYLRATSNIYLDGDIGSVTGSRIATGGVFGAGGDVQTFTAKRVDSGLLVGRAVGGFRVTGPFAGGRTNFLELGSVNVGGTFSGSISSDHDIGAVTFAAVNLGRIRSGGNIGAITARSILGGLVSARDAIASVNVAGDVSDTSIYAGVDLGRDATFGGSGLDADLVSNGTIGTVNIGGGFPKSDISAGVYRGRDGFLGTADDVAADGRSSVGTVTIGGTNLGSSINSQQYRIISTGSLGLVTASGGTVSSQGNFAVRTLGALPVPVSVTDLNVFEDSRVYRAELSFNQPIDASTLNTALTIAEVRNAGATLVGLAAGVDYTVRYNSTTNVATITFSRSVTDRSLPQQPGLPGPGLFRFVLNGAIFRGASQGVMLDGNGDGSTGDDFSQDAIVGDAGDKITSASNTLPDGTIVDFYPAADLNILLDSNYASDNNPDVNRTVRIRGTLGDHPDGNSNFFRAGGDLDVYAVSLRAGQVLVIGALQGNAASAEINLLTTTGFAGPGQAPLPLPTEASDDTRTIAGQQQFLIRKTGTYYIVLGGTAADQMQFENPTFVPNSDPVGNATGSYAFDVLVFDDGNTGFSGDTDSGDGSTIVDAPLPIVFAGSDGQFNTGDDLSVFTSGRFSFTLDRGPDGRPNTADDVVSGSDGGEITTLRRSGADRIWNTTDDERRTTVAGAIGLPGAIGVPNQVAPDADVYRLNAGQPILPGTRVRLTLRLTDSAGNIGLSQPEIDFNNFDFDTLNLASLQGSSLLGDVQIALFELPAGTGFGDAKLVASPSEFLPIGGQDPSTTSDGVNSYGYDANGDFFMEIVLPGGQDVAGVDVPAVYAAYVQGAIRSDYTLEILTQGTGAVQRSSQNVLIETRGGFINWLEAAGVTTQIDAFDAAVLGFAGQIDGVDVEEYIVASLVANLNSIFAAVDADIRVSNDAAQFEGANFSTVYLAGNTEPSAFYNDGTFGASEHVDMFNIDKNDQAVVFAPSLAPLVGDSSQAGVDALVRSLTAAVGRRIGELIGLRMVRDNAAGASVDIMWQGSVTNPPATIGGFTFANASAILSDRNDAIVDTNFYLGSQNSFQLLQRIIKRRA